MKNKICEECGGTILPHSVSGAERGTCHCPRGPGCIRAQMFYGPGALKKYSVEWEGEVIDVSPPTLVRAVVVLDDLRAEWIALHQIVLRTVCAWCGVLIHDGALPLSHGICEDCHEKEFGHVQLRWFPPSLPKQKEEEPVRAVVGRRWPAWSVLLWSLLLCAHGLTAQVSATALLTNGVAELRVGNPTASPVSIDISLFRDATKADGPVTLGDSVSALISPRSFVLQPGQVQAVRIKVRDSVTAGEMLRLATMFTPQSADSTTGMRLLIRTRLISKVLVAVQ